MKPTSKKIDAKPKGKAADTQGSNTGSLEQKKSKGKSRGKGSLTKPTAKRGDVDFEDPRQADPDEQDDEHAHDEPQEDDPEAYVIAAATSSSESDLESDGMLDWSPSECKDYKVGIATVACAASDSLDTKGNVGMAWTLLSSQSTSTITKMSVYAYLEGRHLARPHSTASTNYPCKAPGSALLDFRHRARKVRGVPQTQKGLLSMDRGDSF